MKTSSLKRGAVLRHADRRPVVGQRRGNSGLLRGRTKKQPPLQRVEIDHTALDIFLVSSKEGDDEELFA